MVRKTPIPLLRFLPVGETLVTCRQCRRFVFQTEACADSVEQQGCRSRAEVDARPFHSEFFTTAQASLSYARNL